MCGGAAEANSAPMSGTSGRSRPAVSIVVPCYNAAETLPQTIDSIRAQTMQDWEAICTDDGSTDSTLQLLEMHADEDPRIRFAHAPHRGPAAARNAGLRRARAERVLFLDAEKKGYVDYLDKLLPLIRPGGLILGHDMHRPMPDPRYIEAITTNPDLDTSFIMMESFGISMTVNKR